MNNKQIRLFSLPVFVAALGYFVDVYDLLLFTIVRQPSVLAVGSTLETIIVDSAHIINWQMSGLLIGGILWGVIGDKLGRLKVLFGSILLYSVANIVTGYVQTVDFIYDGNKIISLETEQEIYSFFYSGNLIIRREVFNNGI